MFGLFTIGNIVLNSRWTKGYISRVLEQKTGEKWEIGTITCSLNGVLHLYALEGQLGDGGILVEHLSVRPNYGLLAERKLRISDIYLERLILS